jgi:hypothetical protein
MSVSVKITGLNEFKYHIREFSEKQRRRLKMALDSVLIDIVNWIKNNHKSLGGWEPHTNNLTNSIGWGSTDASFSPIPASKTTITPDVMNLDGGSKWEGNVLSGAVFAGMEYAIYVEFKEGHWVLSGGFNEFRPKIMELLRERAGF